MPLRLRGCLYASIPSDSFGQNHLCFSVSPQHCEAKMVMTQLCKLCVGKMRKAQQADPLSFGLEPHFPQSVPSGGADEGAEGPWGKLLSGPESREARWRPRARRDALREGVPDPGATCPILSLTFATGRFQSGLCPTS